MYGWLTENDSYPSGGVLIESGTAGELGLATAVGAAGIADDVMFGFLPPMSPRRQDLVPLTSGTAPASALPRQRTLPAALTPDLGNPADEDRGGTLFHPFLPGQIFAAHLVSGVAQGTDLTSAATDIYRGVPTGALLDTSFAETLTAGAANLQVNYATRADEYVMITNLAAVLQHIIQIGFANPQPISWAAGVPSAGPQGLAVGTTVNAFMFATILPGGTVWF